MHTTQRVSAIEILTTDYRITVCSVRDWNNGDNVPEKLIIFMVLRLVYRVSALSRNPNCFRIAVM